MIRFRLLSITRAAHFLEAFLLRAGHWDPGVVGFFTFSLPHSPTRLHAHSPSSYVVITHLLAHRNLPTRTIRLLESCALPGSLSSSLWLLNQLCLFEDFWVWGGWMVMVVCVWREALIKECIRGYINRQVLCVGWFFWFLRWAIRAAFTFILSPSSTPISSLAMFQWKGNPE